MDNPEYTTISIRKETKKRLRKYGSFGETWDQLINKILDEINEWRTKNELNRKSRL